MNIDDFVLVNVAHLAKIELSSKQKNQLQSELGTILELVEQISSTNTDNVAPLAHPLEASQPLRIDKAEPVSDIDKIQSLAPHTEQGMYIVPKVID